jgi:hypothetical protein
MSKEMTLYVKNELAVNMSNLTKGTISQLEANALAQRAIDELDWNNSALWHKGFSSTAAWFLQKIGYVYNYITKMYELASV